MLHALRVSVLVQRQQKTPEKSGAFYTPLCIKVDVKRCLMTSSMIQAPIFFLPFFGVYLPSLACTCRLWRVFTVFGVYLPFLPCTLPFLPCICRFCRVFAVFGVYRHYISIFPAWYQLKTLPATTLSHIVSFGKIIHHGE